MGLGCGTPYKLYARRIEPTSSCFPRQMCYPSGHSVNVASFGTILQTEFWTKWKFDDLLYTVHF